MGVMPMHHSASPPDRPAGPARAKPTVELVLSGDLDMHNAEELKRCLAEGMEGACDLVLNLADVGLIDCVCLEVLVQAAKAAQALDCTLSLIAPSSLVRLTMRITETDTLFRIYADRAEAFAGGGGHCHETVMGMGRGLDILKPVLRER
jgi:anti-anti-sigma factor